MWPNPQFPADLKSLMENFVFCAVRANIFLENLQKTFFETALLIKSFMTEVPIK